MSNQIAPRHGGLRRIAINGGQNSGRIELPFRASSVNVDNWSPYWYKLNPVEEYIPPFQHDVSISLQLLNSFELVCEAPPGLEQADTASSTAGAGNFQPVISIFSSYGANNDAGFNAIDSAANIATPVNVAAINAPGVLFTFDLTNYNGIYLFVFANDIFDVEIAYETPVGYQSFYTRSMYNNEQVLFTIPKLSQHVRVSIVNAVNANPQNLFYSTRPFIGAIQTFSCEQMASYPAANPTSQGDMRTITGGTANISWPVRGIDNATISIKMQNVGAATATTRINIALYVSNYAQSAALARIASYSFLYGDGLTPLIIPVIGLLQRQVTTISVVATNTLGASAVTDYALHHSVDDNFIALTPPDLLDVAYDRNTVVQSVVGTGITNFTITNEHNGYLIIKPRGGNGEVLSSAFWVQVFISNFGNTSNALVYSKTFTYGEGKIPLVLPLLGMLSKQFNVVSVQINNAIPSSIVDVSYQHLSDSLIIPEITQPAPYSTNNQNVLIQNTFNNVVVIPVGGALTKMSVTIQTVAAAQYIAVVVGTAVTQDVTLAVLSCAVINTYFLDFPPLPLYSGFSTIWIYCSPGVNITVSWVLKVE